jgi:hypothetical protein
VSVQVEPQVSRSAVCSPDITTAQNVTTTNDDEQRARENRALLPQRLKPSFNRHDRSGEPLRHPNARRDDHRCTIPWQNLFQGGLDADNQIRGRSIGSKDRGRRLCGSRPALRAYVPFNGNHRLYVRPETESIRRNWRSRDGRPLPNYLWRNGFRRGGYWGISVQFNGEMARGNTDGI